MKMDLMVNGIMCAADYPDKDIDDALLPLLDGLRSMPTAR